MSQEQYNHLIDEIAQARANTDVLFCLPWTEITAQYDPCEWVKSNLGATFIDRATFDTNNEFWKGQGRVWAWEVSPDCVEYYLTPTETGQVCIIGESSLSAVGMTFATTAAVNTSTTVKSPTPSAPSTMPPRPTPPVGKGSIVIRIKGIIAPYGTTFYIASTEAWGPFTVKKMAFRDAPVVVSAGSYKVGDRGTPVRVSPESQIVDVQAEDTVEVTFLWISGPPNTSFGGVGSRPPGYTGPP
jgi:hypothetical protein